MAITLLKLPEELHLRILETCDSQSIGRTIISFGKKLIGNIMMKHVNILIEQRLLQNFHNYPIAHKDEKKIPDCHCDACQNHWMNASMELPMETPMLVNKYEANQRFFDNKEELDQLAEDVDDVGDAGDAGDAGNSGDAITLSQSQRMKRMIENAVVHSISVSQTEDVVETNTILSIQDMSLLCSSDSKRVLILVSSSRVTMCGEGCWCGGKWETVIDCVFPDDTERILTKGFGDTKSLWAFCLSFGGYDGADTNCNYCTEDVAPKLLKACGLKNYNNDISFLIETFTTMAPSKFAGGNQFELFDFKTRKRLDIMEEHGSLQGEVWDHGTKKRTMKTLKTVKDGPALHQICTEVFGLKNIVLHVL